MRQKNFLILSLVLGGVFVLTTAFASAASVWKVDKGFVSDKLVVGKNNNKGKLFVKGTIKNPVKGKKIKIDDSVNVTGNLKVNGILQGNNIVSSDNLGTGVVTEGKLGSASVTADKLGTGAVTADKLGTGAVSSAKIADNAVTSDKVDFTMDGVVKAGVKVGSDGTIASGSFCNIANCAITNGGHSTGQYIVSFGTDVSDRFVQVTPIYDAGAVISVIYSQSVNNVVVYFYNLSETNINPNYFYLNLF